MKVISVVAAIIQDDAGRVFCTQRGYGEWKDWWEFPSGKIEGVKEPVPLTLYQRAKAEYS